MGTYKSRAASEEPPKIHKELKKAESSVLTQIRTGRIGLAAFLNKARVPNFPSPICQCGQAEETALYIIAYCPRFAEQRQGLAVGRPDIKKLEARLRERNGSQDGSYGCGSYRSFIMRKSSCEKRKRKEGE